MFAAIGVAIAIWNSGIDLFPVSVQLFSGEVMRLPKTYTSDSSRREPAMADVQRERLVILEARLADEARAKLEAVGLVTQVLRPRLLLIRADPKVDESVARIKGVLGIYDAVPPSLPSDLSSEERVFISAWDARRQPKTRPGEGLPWDAPGFVAPDAPTKRSK